MGDLSHMNLILKIALSVIGGAFIISLLVIVKLSLRPPLVITVLADGRAVPTAFQFDGKSTIENAEIERFIQEFISYKYNWAPDTIESQLKKAAFYLAQSVQDEIKKKVGEDISYVKSTGMTQHVYVKEIHVSNPKKNEYEIIGDRVIGIKGAKFTSNFKLELQLQKERRTRQNLSGLKITRLKETLKENES